MFSIILTWMITVKIIIIAICLPSAVSAPFTTATMNRLVDQLLRESLRVTEIVRTLTSVISILISIIVILIHASLISGMAVGVVHCNGSRTRESCCSSRNYSLWTFTRRLPSPSISHWGRHSPFPATAAVASDERQQSRRRLTMLPRPSTSLQSGELSRPGNSRNNSDMAFNLFSCDLRNKRSFCLLFSGVSPPPST